MDRRKFLRDTPVAASLIRSGWTSDSTAARVRKRGEIPLSSFDTEAFKALPIEKSYAFHERLSAGGWHVRRDPEAKSGPEEMTISATGWSILTRSSISEPLRRAAEDLRAYLDAGMQTRVDVRTAASLADWPTRKKAIVVGTARDLPGCGTSLTGTKDYQIVVAPEQIVVCGYDDLGAMYGLYNLEERMDLREAPFLPRDLNTVRHSLFKARMTLSGMGWMEWPDSYLAWLPRYGFDSIFASVYANPNGSPAPPFVSTFLFRTQDPARMHDLLRRAARYGIRVYCPILHECTGRPDNEEQLRKLVRDIVTQFPEIRGYVLLTEGFYYTPWFGAGGQGHVDLHEWVRHWAKGVGIVAEECHRVNPAIEVLPWDYNVDFRASQVEVKRYIIDEYPDDVIPLVTWENGKTFTFDGETGYARDYSINVVGPSEVAAAQFAEAKRRGMQSVYSNADTWSCQEFGTFPYLPVPYQWYERYKGLEEHGVNGTMESWTTGFKPNFVAEMRAWYSWSDAPPLESLLRQIAHRDFGAGSEEVVLDAWKEFSSAIRLNPDSGPTEGGNTAVANPLLLEQPAEHIMTLKHSFLDQEKWVRNSFLNPYWPYFLANGLGSYLVYPDFTNRVNVAEEYAKPFTLKVFKKYLLLSADGMEQGLHSYRRAALNAPPSKKQRAFREVLLAEQLQRMMRSSEAVLEFEDLRFHLSKTASPSERLKILDRMADILRQEIARTHASLETARRDSRLGYEWEQDYWYWPEVIEKKLRLLRETLENQIPAYKRECHQVSTGRQASTARGADAVPSSHSSA